MMMCRDIQPGMLNSGCPKSQSITAMARGDDDDDDDDGEVDSKRLIVYRKHVDFPTPLAPQIMVRVPVGLP